MKRGDRSQINLPGLITHQHPIILPSPITHQNRQACELEHLHQAALDTTRVQHTGIVDQYLATLHLGCLPYHEVHHCQVLA